MIHEVHKIHEILESAIFQGFRPEGWYIKERMTGVEPSHKTAYNRWNIKGLLACRAEYALYLL